MVIADRIHVSRNSCLLEQKWATRNSREEIFWTAYQVDKRKIFKRRFEDSLRAESNPVEPVFENASSLFCKWLRRQQLQKRIFQWYLWHFNMFFCLFQRPQYIDAAMYDLSFKNKEKRPLQEAVQSFLPWYSKHLGLNFPSSKKQGQNAW